MWPVGWTQEISMDADIDTDDDRAKSIVSPKVFGDLLTICAHMSRPARWGSVTTSTTRLILLLLLLLGVQHLALQSGHLPVLRGHAYRQRRLRLSHTLQLAVQVLDLWPEISGSCISLLLFYLEIGLKIKKYNHYIHNIYTVKPASTWKLAWRLRSTTIKYIIYIQSNLRRATTHRKIQKWLLFAGGCLSRFYCSLFIAYS